MHFYNKKKKYEFPVRLVRLVMTEWTAYEILKSML